VSLEGGDNKRLYPNTTLGPDRENPTNKTVKIAINDTDYFRAWGRYFEDSLGAEVTLDESERRVEASLDPPGTPTQITTSGVSKKEYDAPSNDPFNDGVEDGVRLPSVDRLITNYVEYGRVNEDTPEVTNLSSCDDGGSCDSSDPFIFNGSDYTMSNGDFDATSGNITVVVDGDLTIETMEVDVTDSSDNSLKIFTTGDLTFAEGYDVIVDSDNAPDNFIFHVPSNRAVTFGEGGASTPPDGFGTVYAPDSLVELSEMGNSEWTGPLVGETLRADGISSNADINFPSSASGGSVNVRRANDSFNLYVTEKKVGIDR